MSIFFCHDWHIISRYESELKREKNSVISCLIFALTIIYLLDDIEREVDVSITCIKDQIFQCQTVSEMRLKGLPAETNQDG